MPYFSTAQEWLEQSTLLLQARPTTTRISTKYAATPPSKVKSKSKSTKSATSAIEPPTTTEAPAPPPAAQATLILKTYDPVSGVALKYSTDKAAEVGRLVSSMARLGRIMAGLPELKEDAAMLDAHVEGAGAGAGAEGGSGVATPVPDASKAGASATGGQAGGGQGARKKGKKGKK